MWLGKGGKGGQGWVGVIPTGGGGGGGLLGVNHARMSVLKSEGYGSLFGFR